MANRYFIIDADDENLTAIMDFCVGTLDKQRYSLDLTKIVIKLCEGDLSNHPELSGYTEYSHSAILTALDDDFWRDPDV